jgi:ADP-ribose pyrophosphatase
MSFTEKKIDGEEKYHGVIIRVRLDHVELTDGTITRREVVEHPGGVCILPVDREGNAYLVRQYRYPAQKEILEAPAGKLEKGEEPFACAVRELSEETGFTAKQYLDCGTYYTSPGYSDETLHLYLARELEYGEMHPDRGEFLRLEKFPLQELAAMVRRGEIEDAKTAILILRAIVESTV